MPFIFLVETLSTGRMVPRVQSRYSFLTNIFLFSIAAYAAVYGVTYAYVLHHLANILCAWLVAIHFDMQNITAKKAIGIFEVPGTAHMSTDIKKRP